MRLKDLTHLVLENSNAFIKQNDIVTVFSFTTSVQALGKQKSFVLQVCCKKKQGTAGENVFVFESFGTNNFIFLGCFVSSVQKGNRSK